MYPFASSLPDVSSKLKGIAASYCGDYNQSNTNSTSSKTQKILFIDVIRRKFNVSVVMVYVTNELEYSKTIF
jgi:hypothetical protein